ARAAPWFQHVTYSRIRCSVAVLWLLVLVLSCLPLLGVGRYFGAQGRCVRYRSAWSGRHRAYAFLMLAVGLGLCTLIVACNMAVVRVLCARAPASPPRRTVVRKDSRELAFDQTTAEELSFARLMVALCVFFVLCWLPQMMTIVVAQLNPGLRSHVFYRIADSCMALNFTLDPLFYVLSRKGHRARLARLLAPLCR
ncbi:unnamed protein product, partial [Ixodes hexagonus]